jgi:hypothetical protein
VREPLLPLRRLVVKLEITIGLVLVAQGIQLVEDLQRGGTVLRARSGRK